MLCCDVRFAVSDNDVAVYTCDHLRLVLFVVTGRVGVFFVVVYSTWPK